MTELNSRDLLPHPDAPITVAGLEMTYGTYDLPDILNKQDEDIRNGLRELDMYSKKFYGESYRVGRIGGGALTAASIEAHSESDQRHLEGEQ